VMDQKAFLMWLYLVANFNQGEEIGP
jgi:hypothetical protein